MQSSSRDGFDHFARRRRAAGVRRIAAAVAAGVLALGAVGAGAQSSTVVDGPDRIVVEARDAFARRDRARLSAARESAAAAAHPLAMWVEYWELNNRLGEATQADLDAFYARWPGTYVEDRLRNDWLLELGRRQDWANFAADHPRFRMNDDREVTCYAVLVDHLAGKEVAERARQAWYAQREPDTACALMAGTLHAAQVLRDADVWHKARLAMDTGRPRAVQQAADIVGGEAPKAVSAMLDSPARYLMRQASTRTRAASELAALALLRLAGNDLDATVRLLEQRWERALPADLAAWVWASVGRRAAQNLLPEAPDYFQNAEERLAQRPRKGDAGDTDWSDDTLAWKARAALRASAGVGEGITQGAGRWMQVRQAIDAMDEESKQDPAWVYWKARALLALAPPAPAVARPKASLGAAEPADEALDETVAQDADRQPDETLAGNANDDETEVPAEPGADSEAAPALVLTAATEADLDAPSKDEARSDDEVTGTEAKAPTQPASAVATPASAATASDASPPAAPAAAAASSPAAPPTAAASAASAPTTAAAAPSAASSPATAVATPPAASSPAAAGPASAAARPSSAAREVRGDTGAKPGAPAASPTKGKTRRARKKVRKPEPQRALAMEMLESIAGQMNFYGTLAAEELGRVVTLPERPAPLSDAERETARANAGLTRALHLIAIGLRGEGVREWNFSLRGLGDRALLAAAERACEREVWDRCINTSDRTRSEIDMAQRFPTPFRSQVVSRAREIGLDPAYVYGLIRQESRFIMDARSSAGASGLMQIMPATARWTARKTGVPYSNDMISDRDMNLKLGTSYLKLVLDDFGGSQALAAAAYNAGPRRPHRWREGPVLETAAWAENIPFAETRDYVKKVLFNAAYYDALLNGGTKLALKPRLGPLVGPRAPEAPLPSTELP